MAKPDMDVIKEIPGYKVILKAILKSQIQQLVEQLASTTDEESVILTANVSDGTLSHLGSDSGKFFLEDHEDIKSEFLGFCLKRQHRQKQEREREAAMKREEALRMSQLQSQYVIQPPSGPRFMQQRSPRMQRPAHPVHLSRASPGSGGRGGLRHEPYPMTRPKRTSLSFEGQPGLNTPPKQPIVKTEPDIDNDGDANTSSPSHSKPDTERDDDAKSNSSSATLPIDTQDVKLSDTQPPGGFGLDSDFSNLISGDTSQHSDNNDNDGNETDTARTVKTEALSDTEMELEITGVEPGKPMVPQESWEPNTSAGLDQSGVSGRPADFLANNFGKLFNDRGFTRGVPNPKWHTCMYCGKGFKNNCKLQRHFKSHTGVKPFNCEECGKTFSEKSNMQQHVRLVHLKLGKVLNKH